MSKSSWYSLAMLALLSGSGCMLNRSPVTSSGSRVGVPFLSGPTAMVRRPPGFSTVPTQSTASHSHGLPPTMQTGIQNLSAVGSLHAGAADPRVKVTAPEAASVATWFAHSVDLRGDYRVASVDLDTTGWARTYSSSPVYLVELQTPGDSKDLVVHVDAHSGDPIFAYDPTIKNPPASVAPKMTPTVTKTIDTWRSRLHLAIEVKSDLIPGRFDAEVGGYPVLNLNGYTWASFTLHDGRFERFQGYGALPPLPKGKPTVPADRAIALAIAERKKTMPNWPQKLITHARLTVFYDENSASSKWVWNVQEGFVLDGEFHESFTHYIDANDESVISNEKFNVSRWMYHSRDAREGLANLGRTRVDIPLLSDAHRLLQQMGRTDLVFERFKVNNGLELSSGFETKMALGPKGDLISFSSRPIPGKVDDASALARGRKFILAQHLALPEGAFGVTRAISSDGDGTDVYFQQRALGYDYFQRQVVEVVVGGGGSISKYNFVGAQPRPAGVPAKILPPPEVEAPILAYMNAHLPKDTDRIHYFARVKAGKLGWWADSASGPVRLCYDVTVMTEQSSIGGTQGGGRSYKYDAETGKCLEKFP